MLKRRKCCLLCIFLWVKYFLHATFSAFKAIFYSMQLEYNKRSFVSFSWSRLTHTVIMILKLPFSFHIVVTVCIGWDKKLSKTTNLLLYSSCIKLLSFYYIQVILDSLKEYKSTRSQRKVVVKTILPTVSFKTPFLSFCSKLLKNS